MNDTDGIYRKGDIICRPADWMDAAKFFLFNYGLHALSVLSPPGSTVLNTAINTCFSLLFPYYGIYSAMGPLICFANGQATDLKKALRAGALCMVAPSTHCDKMDFDRIIAPPTHRDNTDLDTFIARQTISGPVTFTMSTVNGQYPAATKRHITSGMPLGDEANGPPVDLRLVPVPRWFEVNPLLEPGPEAVSTSLACNYNFIKIIAAILQVLYGSFELYKARGDQLEKYGYGAYALTTIPYVLMSITNLIASLTCPQYPSMFIVHYGGFRKIGGNNIDGGQGGREEEFRSLIAEAGGTNNDASPRTVLDGQPRGERNYPAGWLTDEQRKRVEERTSGTVGIVYGDYNLGKPAGCEEFDFFNKGAIKYRKVIASYLAYPLIAVPYVIIYLLTGFKTGQSTKNQRGWLVSWYVIGTIGASLPSFIRMMEKYKEAVMVNHGLQSRFESTLVYFSLILAILSYGIPTIGGFAVVMQMILGDQICSRI